MGSRLDLHSTFLLICKNVYFQPPDNLKLVYPCIVYCRSNEVTTYANDLPYAHKKRYQVTVIDRNPDSEIPDQISKLPMCAYDRNFRSENLNHDVYNIYY